MHHRTCRAAALLSALTGLAPAARAVADERPRRAVPVYTNDDLDRVRSRRGETGVDSVPAYPPASESAGGESARRGSRPRREPAGAEPAGSDEAFWRRSAAQVRVQAQNLRRRAAEWGRRIEEHRARRKPGAAGAALVRSWEARRADLLAQADALEADLEERARRARAWPGWLR